MAKEIERKFLVDRTHPEVIALMAQPGSHIAQGYISSAEKGVVRVRLIDGQGFLTIKGATTGISRDEYEYEIPADDAASLLNGQCITFLQKQRRRYPLEDGLEIELDFFTDLDLMIAEIELPDENTPFNRPDWLIQEVSHDPAYFNNNLARRV